MNLKFLTFSVLSLFFIITTKAQDSNIVTNSKIDLVLSVTDSPQPLHFNLISQSEYLISPETDVIFNLKLEYLSEVDTVSFFRLSYTIYEFTNGTIGRAIQGITVPVIIPPVRKKKQEFDRAPEMYPFEINTNYTVGVTNYFAEINLIQYDTKLDCLNKTNGYEGPATEFQLTPIVATSTDSVTAESYSMIAYPNPSTDRIIIKYANMNATAKKKSILSQNLEVAIFNEKGIKFSNHSLTHSTIKNNSIQYLLDITHLPKGNYYFQLKRGEKTHIKTIVKK